MNNNKTKILVVTERFFPEEFIINDLVSEWIKKGLSVSVLTQIPSYPAGKVFSGYKNRFYYKENCKGIDVYRFRTVQGYKGSLFFKILNYINFVILGSVVALFIGKNFDKIFVYQTGPLTLAIPAVVIKKVYSKDITIWTQDIWPDSVYAYGFKKTIILTKFLDWFVRFIYGNCKQFFIPCEGQRNLIGKYTENKNIHYAPNWSFLEDANKDSITLSENFNFTFAGNIGKVQNLDNVIKGFALAQKEKSSIQLNLIGDGSALNELKELVKKEQINNVVFWPRTSSVEIGKYLRASDVLVVSLKDNPIFEVTIPAKFQAYLMMEKPIFCIMNGELKNIVEKNKIGLCAFPSDIDDIKTKFLYFYSFNKAELHGLIDNIRITKDRAFNRVKVINELTRLFLVDV